MSTVTSQNFDLLIAYILPGFVSVWGAGHFSETLQGWLSASPGDSPTIGGFLYVTLASIGAGALVSAIRWLIIDRAYRHTGIPEPNWDFSSGPESSCG